jgi:DNA-binding HxlR family transcriptional regulator
VAEPQYDPYSRTGPSRKLLAQIGAVWTVLVIGALAEGPLRFTELSKRVDGISMKMLTQTLRALERDGLATRKHHLEIPPRVVYELTATGRTLVGPLAALETWAVSHMTHVLEARERFDPGTD